MLQSFKKFKKFNIFLNILVFILTWASVSLLVNLFGIYVVGVEFGNTDSFITNIFSFMALPIPIIGSIFTVGIFTKYRYKRWVEKNFKFDQIDSEEVMAGIVDSQDESLCELINLDSGDNERFKKLYLKLLHTKDSRVKRNQKLNQIDVFYSPISKFIGLGIFVGIPTAITFYLFVQFFSTEQEIYEYILVPFILILFAIVLLFLDLLIVGSIFAILQYVFKFHRFFGVIFDINGLLHRNEFLEWDKIILPPDLQDFKSKFIESKVEIDLVDGTKRNYMISKNEIDKFYNDLHKYSGLKVELGINS